MVFAMKHLITSASSSCTETYKTVYFAEELHFKFAFILVGRKQNWLQMHISISHLCSQPCHSPLNSEPSPALTLVWCFLFLQSSCTSVSLSRSYPSVPSQSVRFPVILFHKNMFASKHNKQQSLLFLSVICWCERFNYSLNIKSSYSSESVSHIHVTFTAAFPQQCFCCSFHLYFPSSE